MESLALWQEATVTRHGSHQCIQRHLTHSSLVVMQYDSLLLPRKNPEADREIPKQRRLSIVPPCGVTRPRGRWLSDICKCGRRNAYFLILCKRSASLPIIITRDLHGRVFEIVDEDSTRLFHLTEWNPIICSLSSYGCDWSRWYFSLTLGLQLDSILSLKAFVLQITLTDPWTIKLARERNQCRS